MKIELCKYKGGADSAFTFTFDDGCYLESSREVLDNFISVYQKYGVKIKATVGITVNFMHEALIDFWKASVKDGYFEIGSHSVGHDLSFSESTPYERREGDAKSSQLLLKNMFKGEAVETYILPGGSYDQKGLLPLKDYYIAVRGNKDGINYPEKIDWLDIKCFTAMLKRPLEDYTSYIDEVIKGGGWGVQMNHWITHKSEDTFHSQGAYSFKDECDYLGKKAQEGDVWVGSFAEVTKYIRRYENSRLSVTEQNGKLVAEIITKNDAFLDTPLTISIETDTPIIFYYNGGRGEEIEPIDGKILVEVDDFVVFEPKNK
ncbi:MAG: polysaccharide deacetylase family protein [Clostridia bacterium]|nr:polysaccharide deacetylase family protein [Clostridia bacterium]